MICKGSKIFEFVAKRFLILLSLSILLLSTVSATTSIQFGPGAYIIDMGSFPATQSTGLKPYGLIYDLVINQQIPVYWAIDPSKSKDGFDFYATTSDAGTKGYRGGSFIIPAEYVPFAITTINTWKAQGIIVNGPSLGTFTAPVYDIITSFPNAVCDLQNGAIIINAFYLPSGVPSSSYRLGSPQDLKPCDDIYAMPHADPQSWTALQKTTFYNFIDRGGSLWAACHAVSALEAPTPTYLGWYFLSTNGLIPWGSHSNPVPPYSYDPASAVHPIMQFIGKLDNALLSGSEQVYLPRIGSAWRASSTVAVWDPDQVDVLAGKSPGKAGIVINGYAFGNSSKGYIVYEASHRLTTGNVSENVAAARVYGNYLIYVGTLRRPEIDINVPSSIVAGQIVNVSASITGGTPPYSVSWSSSCGGTFANSSALTTTFTAPTVTSTSSCIIRVTVKDACNRKNFAPQLVTIYPRLMEIDKTDFKLVVQPGDVLNYSIYYNNTGPLTAENVILTDLLPAQITYIPIAYPAPLSVTPNMNGTTTLTWSLGNIPAGSYRQVRLNASVKEGVSSGTITDLARLAYNISGIGPFYVYAQDTDLVVPVTKTVDRSLAVISDYLNYSICARYDGSSFLKNATVKDVLPPYTTYVDNSTTADGSYYPANRTIVWHLGSNTPGVPTRSYPGTNTLNIQAQYDTYIRSGGSADNNYGASTQLEIASGSRRALMYFPLSIPPGATISSATLHTYVTQAVSGATISIFRLLRDWCMLANQCACPGGRIVEGTLCDNEPDALAEGFGSTWNHYSYNKNAASCPWATAGGDYDKVTSYGTFTPAAGTRTADVTTLVTGWYSGSIPVQGILLEYDTDQRTTIDSRESGTAPRRPALIISHTGTGSPVTAVATSDTYLRKDQAVKNYGSCTALELDGGNDNDDRRPMLYFTLPALPIGATITNVQLRVYVNTAMPGTVTVRRLTRDWCTQPNSCLCQNKIVEGKLDGAVPDTAAEGFGSTWNNYYYNGKAVACPWTTPGGDYAATVYGTFSAGTTGAKTATVTSLVQGWNAGSIPLQGILMTSSLAGTARIASREYGTTSQRPYLSVTYTVGQGTNLSLWARPLMVCEDGLVNVNMTANVSTTQTILTAPATLDINALNATLTLVSGPSPASYSNVPALENRYFEYVYSVQSTGYPGSVSFSGKPTATQDIFAKATSNSLIIAPVLNYTVQINATTPQTVDKIDNMANFNDENVFISPVESSLARTNLEWPASINVTKTVNTAEGASSTILNFTLTIKNTGLATLDPVQVVDTLPAGLDYVSSNGSVNNKVVTWSNIGPLEGGQQKKLYLIAHIDGTYFGYMTNVVNVTGTTQDEKVIRDNATLTVRSLRKGLYVEKSANVTAGPPSTYVKFLVNVTNTGEVTLDPVAVQDFLVEGLEYKSSNATYVDAANGTLTWTNIGPMTASQKKTLEIVAHINGDYYETLFNSVVATGKPPVGGNITEVNSTSVYAQKPSLIVDKKANVTYGAPCTYVNFSINVRNDGEVVMDPITLMDKLPYGLNYISSNGTASGGTVTWSNIGPLDPGDYRIFYLVAHINGTALGNLTNEVNVTGRSPTGLDYPSYDNETVNARRAELLVNKTVDPEVAFYNQQVDFFINVTNLGNITLDVVRVEDELPLGLTYVSNNRSGIASGSNVTWSNLGPLAPGASTYINLKAYVDGSSSGMLTDQVWASGKPTYGGNVTSQDSAEVEALLKSSISVVKEADPKEIGPGDNVTFVINVTNTGDVSQSVVRVLDILPIGLTYVSDNRSGSVSGNLITWENLGPLGPGNSTYIQLNATSSI